MQNTAINIDAAGTLALASSIVFEVISGERTSVSTVLHLQSRDCTLR
jgi:hypothetical protein